MPVALKCKKHTRFAASLYTGSEKRSELTYMITFSRLREKVSQRDGWCAGHGANVGGESPL